MSFATVLKNVYTFAQILSQSSTETVHHWDVKSLNNAFNWAAYCEQVYDHVKYKPLRETLEKHLQEMTSLLTPASCLVLDVECLRRATEILQEKLLLNTHLKVDIFEKIVIEKSNGTANIKFSEKLHQLALLSNTAKICEELVAEFKTSCDYSQITQIPDQSQYLYTHFVKQASIVTKADRFSYYVKSVLTRLSELKGMVTIICLIAVYEDKKKDGLACHSIIYNLVLTWLQTISVEKPHELLEVDKSILCNVAVSNTDFLNLYLQCLIDWGNSMKPDYSEKYFPKLYKWRNPTDQANGNYEKLIEHFRYLYLFQNYLKTVILDGLKNLIGTDCFTIWKDILKDLYKLDKG